MNNIWLIVTGLKELCESPFSLLLLCVWKAEDFFGGLPLGSEWNGGREIKSTWQACWLIFWHTSLIRCTPLFHRTELWVWEAIKCWTLSLLCAG